MPLDVTFEGTESFTTGSTPVDVKLDGSKPQSATAPSPAPAEPTDPEAAKRAFRGKMFPQPSAQSQPSQQQSGAAGRAAAPAQTWPETPEQAQSRIDRLMASPKFRADYANQNNPDRPKLVEGMVELFKLANPEPVEEGEAHEVNLLDGLRDRETFAGIHQPEMGPNIPGPFEPVDYAEFVEFVIDENIPAATAQNLMEDYATRLVASGGQGLTAEDFADLRAKYAGRLTPQVMDALQGWLEKEVYPRMRAQQGGR